MSRKASAQLYENAREIRDYARTSVDDLFPRAKVDIGVETFSGSLCVSARIIGDTSPYAPEEIEEFLGELGVDPIERIES